MADLSRPSRAIICVAIAVGGLAGCQSGSSDARPSGNDSTAAAAPVVGISGKFDVGGHKLSMTCLGTGSPTIVFESGLGGLGQAGWINIQRSIRSARTCAYDRVNVGSSDRVAERHTGLDSVRELHTLLNVAGVPGPYILVGASFGGLLCIMYAATYPADAAGIVLLDPTPPTWDKHYDLIPQPQRATEIANNENNAEQVDLLDTLELAKPLMPKVPNVPVLLLAATRIPTDDTPSWPAQKMAAFFAIEHQRLIDAVPQGTLRKVESGHLVQFDVPHIVVAELQRLLDATR
jgi:pimeloyl-ACP methyl ester carboxylesterase